MSISQDGRLHKIYLLRDPRDMRVRYVGVTVQTLSQRLSTHLSCARHRPSQYRDWWIRQVLEAGLEPLIELIEETTDRNRECYWIAEGRKAGARLTNLANGGGGTLGVPCSEEKKQKIGQANKGRALTEATKDKLRQANLGKVMPEEVRAKIRDSNKGKHSMSEEQRRHLSEVKKAKPPTEKQKQHTEELHNMRRGCKLSEAHINAIKTHNTGRIISEETRAKQSAARAAWHARRKELRG